MTDKRLKLRATLGNLLRTVLVIATGPMLLLGWAAGLVFHRLHDGWRVARKDLDRLDDACIEKGWLHYGPMLKHPASGDGA